VTALHRLQAAFEQDPSNLKLAYDYFRVRLPIG
jgi:hypothetical protein